MDGSDAEVGDRGHRPGVAIACCMYTACSWRFLPEVNSAVQAVASSTATSVPWHQTANR